MNEPRTSAAEPNSTAASPQQTVGLPAPEVAPAPPPSPGAEASSADPAHAAAGPSLPPAVEVLPPAPPGGRLQRWLPWLSLALCAVCLSWVYSLQTRLKASEEELTRRHDEAVQQVVEARTMAKQAESVSRDMAGKLSLVEARLLESALQRTQLEDLMQSLSRSRDENVLADIEAALRVAQQHAALTGSVEPMLAALKQTEERLSRVQQPRLERVRRAVLSDMDRVKAAGGVDLTTLTLRLDEVARQVDELPLIAALGSAGPTVLPPAMPASGAQAAKRPASAASAAPSVDEPGSWLSRAPEITRHIWSEVRQLIRVTRVDHPEAALLAPEQAVYLRDNLRLRLLSARLSLLSRQFDVAQSDMKQAQALLDRYFDRQSRRVAAAAELLRQTTVQSRAVDIPRPTATLAAIAAATAGR